MYLEQKAVANKDDRIYDEVDEGVYQKIVKNRLLRDDFVEDDNNLGYADNGEEHWDEPEMDEDEDSEEERRRCTHNSLHSFRSAELTEGCEQLGAKPSWLTQGLSERRPESRGKLQLAPRTRLHRSPSMLIESLLPLKRRTTL